MVGEFRKAKRGQGRVKAREALFVTAYIAETWGCDVTLYAPDGISADALDKAMAYLDIHEVTAEEVIPGPARPEPVFAAATALRCDMLVMGSGQKRPLKRMTMAERYMAGAGDFPFSLLICP